MQSIALVVLISFIGAVFSASLYPVSNPLNAPDLPNFTPNPITIPAGSLIIPMDTANQVIVPGTGQLSVLPYGLIVRTLHANISVWWAIQTGKSLNGVDFVSSTGASTFGSIVAGKNANTNPATFGWGSSSTRSYSGGPFIILNKDAQKAFTAWNNWAISPSSYYLTVDPSVYSSVAVHVLQQDTTMDIRHQIYSHPVIAVSNLDGNAPTQTAMLGCIYQNMSGRLCPREDGYGWGDIFGNGAPGCTAFNPVDHAGLDWNVHYKTYDCGYQVAALTDTTCLTTFSEPHWEWYAATGPSYITAMKAFISSGANFLAQCASTQSYENQAGTSGTGTFLSTYGLAPVNPSDGIDPPNTVTEYPDLPVLQYIGQMSSEITGAVPDFYNLFSASDNVPSGWNTQSGNGPHAGAYNDFQSYAFPLVTDVYDSSGDFNGRNIYVAAGAKHNPQLALGSNIWYLTGHTWVGVNDPGTENGRRFFFNAMIVPALRPAACGFSFCEASDVCAPQDACHTCACNAQGTGFVQTAITPCCLSNTDCPGDCQECNTVTHQCTATAGCCTASGSVPCPACQQCTDNVCTAKAGCCTQNSQCGNSPCLVCTPQQTCVTTPGCCDLTSQINPCAGQLCYDCNNATNTCARQQPITGCCLANADCGNNPCKACNLQNNQCYDVPGCCNTNANCGTDPCIICVNNSCVVKQACCTLNTQCGGCQVCNTSNQCAPNPDPNCCTTDAQCGSCRRCAVGFNGTRTCVEISQCCLTQADCETCQNCSNSQCVPIEACCRFDTDCPGCEVCTEFECYVEPHLSCCQSDQDCYLAAQANGNSTDCDWQCQIPQLANGTITGTGVCQQVCSSGRNWTGLIAGLAAGVPAAILFFAGLAALIGFLIYRYKDWLNNFIFANDVFADSGALTSPVHDPAVTVTTSPL